MYLHAITLRNLRNFKSLEFCFDRGEKKYPGWTVITGGNGSGKSTLLRSIAMLLIEDLFQLNHLLSDPHFFIRKQKSEKTEAIATISTKVDFYIVKYTTNKSDQHTPNASLESPAKKPYIFSCGYGPFRRIYGSSEENKNLMSHRVMGRFVTLFRESASLASVDEWLTMLNYKRLEGKEKETKILSTVIDLLNQQFLPNGISIERVDSDGLWLKDCNGTEMTWLDMSDGYRSALALLADILRHMVNHYGLENLTGRDAHGALFVQRNGIVLIDEIDAHLHPEWQREIGFWLKRHFPNVQFIVTSHSPLICQAADPNGLFVLPEPGSDEPARALTPEEYQAVISSKPDTILRSPAFGLRNTRSDWVVDKQTRYAKLKARQRRLQNLTSDETAELAELSRFVNPDEEP